MKKKWIYGTLAVLVGVVAAYALYVVITYHRIEDNQPLKITKAAREGSLKTGEAYRAVSYNIGFGAYTPEFTFFMDGGKSAVAKSKESVEETVAGAAALTESYDADFLLFQEVDLDSTRSYHVDQKTLIDSYFPTYDSLVAVNYDSAYLFFPPWEPHGKSYAGQAVYSRYPMYDAVRRSLPVSSGFNKFLDLDRCYSVNKIQVDNGKQLCLYHVHLSAYGNDEAVRTGQLTRLLSDMEQEYLAGNYVLCGGDFNHDMLQKEGMQTSAESWAQPLPREALPQGFAVAYDLLGQGTLSSMGKSTRKADIPYDAEKSCLVTVDGFLLSDNIELIELSVQDEGFRFSDHNPVELVFSLKE